MLSAKIQSEILYEHFSKNISMRAVAKSLSINRKSVERVIKRGRVSLQRSFGERGSIIDPFEAEIVKMLEADSQLSSKVIFDRIRKSGFPGGYTLVREFVPGLKERLSINKPREAFFSLDFHCGEAGQVDWGEFEDVFGDGVKLHCFIMVLCYSRLIYTEFTRSEKFEDFIRCHENAFSYFGNKKPMELWYDNLATAVSERKNRLIKFNSRFFAYTGHHRFRPFACNKARGNEKGRVENGVKFVRSNFWPDRKFRDFEDLQEQAFTWRDTVNLREHGATKKVPRWVFENEEKAVLESTNPMPYETDEVLTREVCPDFHFTYETNRYSVPWTLVGNVLTIRVDQNWVKVFYKEKFITRHLRSYLKNQRITKSEHEEGLLEIKPQGKGAHQHWQIKALQSYGPSLKEYLEALQHSPRSIKSELARLLCLATVYGSEALNESVGAIIKLGAFGVDRIEQHLRHSARHQEKAPEPINFKDPILARTPAMADLRQYDDLLFSSTKQPSEEEDGSENESPRES